MRKYSVVFLSALTLGSLGFVFTSCDDDPPPAKPKMSFAAAEMTVKESDADLEVQIVLDKPASEDVTIEYSIKGTAREKVAAGAAQLPADYEILSDLEEVEIKKGETTGIIQIDLYSDSDLEQDDETIELSIESIDNDQIEITRDDDMTITVQQEDGLLVFLAWGEEGDNYPDVDMDLFLWAENASAQLGVTNYRGINDDSYTNWIGGNVPEYFFLPTALVDDGSFGLSCTYYEGTKEPMNFEVTFVEIVNGEEAASVSKTGIYQLDNINKWDDETAGTDPLLIVTFKKTGTDFSEFADITVPDIGSRYGITRSSGFERGSKPTAEIMDQIKLLQKK